MGSTQYRLDVRVGRVWMPANAETGSRKFIEKARRRYEAKNPHADLRTVPVQVNEGNPYMKARRSFRSNR